MSTTEKFTESASTEAGTSKTDVSIDETVVQTVDGKRIKGVEGHAPLPDDQPQHEDEDLGALLKNPNANQKPD